MKELTVDTSVSAVRASPLLLGLVHLNVRDDKRIHIQTLDLKDSIADVRNMFNKEIHATAFQKYHSRLDSFSRKGEILRSGRVWANI